jgi:hypothetical protein
MVDDNKKHVDASVHKTFRMMDFKQYAEAPFKVAAYLEIGMSCDASIRRFFRSMGSKVCKLYLGNILNIDIETMTFMPQINFSHHVAGELDEIWVSPHYDIHAEYAGSINALCGKTQIAPYVWDPTFIESLGQVYNDTGLGLESPRTFVSMEPNISFQKNAVIPIMAMEAYYRKFPSRVETMVTINGERLKQNPYYQSSILPYLNIHKDGKLQLMPRAHIVNPVKAFPSAIIILHQVNNEYNYSFLEFHYKIVVNPHGWLRKELQLTPVNISSLISQISFPVKFSKPKFNEGLTKLIVIPTIDRPYKNILNAIKSAEIILKQDYEEIKGKFGDPRKQHSKPK